MGFPEIEKKRYDVECVIEDAILGALERVSSKSGIRAYDIYGEWLEEEGGQRAIDRLVGLIIY